MFIVSSTNQMAKYSAFSAHQGAAAAANYPAESIEDADELGALQFQTHHSKGSVDSSDSASSSSCAFACSGGGGGLRRTVSSLHSTSVDKEEPAIVTGCSHANHKNACIVEAKQVEMDFSTLSNRRFKLTVTAPNGERRELQFAAYGDTQRFAPRLPGCGHGDWTFELVAPADACGRTIVKESIYLDGVGSLFFTVDERLQLRLSSQEFLRLPSASRCCSNALKH